MRQQFDLRSGRVLVALGTLGLGGAYVTTAAVPARAQAGGGEPPARSSGASGDPRGGIVFTDTIGAAAAAVEPDRPLGGRPVVVATETRRNLLVGGSVSVNGSVMPITSTDRAVTLEERVGGRWLTVARTRTHRHGRYRMGFRPAGPGTVKLRVLVAGAGSGTNARRMLGSVNVYRRAFASWYGGGGSLACGGTLTDSTLGVASKTLPCGTMVLFRLGDREVRVPVVDRGPYVAGREFDLTAATKRALGFGDLGTVWATA